MTTVHAKHVLLICRPGSSDDQDVEVAEALELARQDAELRVWHQQHCAFQKLNLTSADLRWSEDVLRDHGNLSSASVYFELQRALTGGAPPGWWWLGAFGAGFSCHGALLKVT